MGPRPALHPHLHAAQIRSRRPGHARQGARIHPFPGCTTCVPSARQCRRQSHFRVPPDRHARRRARAAPGRARVAPTVATCTAHDLTCRKALSFKCLWGILKVVHGAQGTTTREEDRDSLLGVLVSRNALGDRGVPRERSRSRRPACAQLVGRDHRHHVPRRMDRHCIQRYRAGVGSSRTPTTRGRDARPRLRRSR